MTRKKNKPETADFRAIGRRIREIRGFDLTQAEFGALLGVRQAIISKYEKGQAPPTLEFLVRLRAHSGKTIDWIVTGAVGDSAVPP